jgi:hypothetical protein
VCVENRQAGDDAMSQAKISVAARSSKRSVITRRIVDRCAMVGCVYSGTPGQRNAHLRFGPKISLLAAPLENGISAGISC